MASKNFLPVTSPFTPASCLNNIAAMGDLKRKAGEDAPAKANKKKRKNKNPEDESLDMELGLNTLIARLDNQLMADYLAQKTSRFGKDLSTVELADLTISGSFTLSKPRLASYLTKS